MKNEGLKPELETFIKNGVTAAKAAHFVMTPPSMRENSLRTAQAQELPKVEMAHILDAVLDNCGEYDVPVRIYIPKNEQPMSVIVFYHGGGFVIDSIMVYDPICRRIAEATKHIVVAPAYRLAPENRYPAAEVDAIAAARHVFDKLDALHVPYVKSLCVSGDSAGGYLAAVVSATAQHDDTLPITHQILIYPCLDMTCSFPSYTENGIDKYGSNSKKMDWYFEQYLHNVSNKKAVSPAFGEITAKMPKTMMVTVQTCPFRDEGMYYIERLKQAGVPTVSYNITNMVHSYLNFEKICFDEIQFTYEKMGEFLEEQESGIRSQESADGTE